MLENRRIWASKGDPDVHLLTVEEVALILRVPKSCVYAHLSDLPTIRLGRYVRFNASDIEEFLANKGGNAATKQGEGPTLAQILAGGA